MLQDSYNSEAGAEAGAEAAASDRLRSEWIGLLARAPLGLLEGWSGALGATSYTWLRRPEQGLVMLQGRAGGAGERFNLGEMTVTRCTLRLASGACGVAYVQGRSPRRAELAALADALLQQPATADSVRRELIAPLATHLQAQAGRAQRKAQGTKVDFFTVAHGDD